jgi:hypothetical protein
MLIWKKCDVLGLDLEDLIKMEEASKGQIICQCHQTMSLILTPLFCHCIIFMVCSRDIVSDSPILRLSIEVIQGSQQFLQNSLVSKTMSLYYILTGVIAQELVGTSPACI